MESTIQPKLGDTRNAWAYMYDGNLPGIGAHADDSQLQINIYLTPSEAGE